MDKGEYILVFVGDIKRADRNIHESSNLLQDIAQNVKLPKWYQNTSFGAISLLTLPQENSQECETLYEHFIKSSEIYNTKNTSKHPAGKLPTNTNILNQIQCITCISADEVIEEIYKSDIVKAATKISINVINILEKTYSSTIRIVFIPLPITEIQELCKGNTNYNITIKQIIIFILCMIDNVIKNLNIFRTEFILWYKYDKSLIFQDPTTPLFIRLIIPSIYIRNDANFSQKILLNALKYHNRTYSTCSYTYTIVKNILEYNFTHLFFLKLLFPDISALFGCDSVIHDYEYLNTLFASLRILPKYGN